MKPCCQQEAERSIAGHRDVAFCDGCGWLILGYDNQEEADKTVAELGDTPHDMARLGALWIVAKARTGG